MKMLDDGGIGVRPGEHLHAVAPDGSVFEVVAPTAGSRWLGLQPEAAERGVVISSLLDGSRVEFSAADVRALMGQVRIVVEPVSAFWRCKQDRNHRISVPDLSCYECPGPVVSADE